MANKRLMSKVIKIKTDKLTRHIGFYKKLDGQGEKGAWLRFLKGLFVRRLFFKTNNGNFFVKPNFFVSKYLVIGDNPILSALALLYAARNNIDVVYCPLVYVEKDLWGYEHLLSKDLRSKIEKEIGFNSKEYIKLDWNIVAENDEDEFNDWIDQFFSWIKSEISKTGFKKIYRFYEGFTYKLYGKDKLFNRNWFWVISANNAKKEEKKGIDKLIADLFYLKIVRELPVIDVSPTTPDQSANIFANKALVTSMVPDISANKMVENEKGLYNFTYEDRCIMPVGTAHKMIKDTNLFKEQIIADIARIRNIII